MNQPGTAIAPVTPQPLVTEEVLYEGSPALIPGLGSLLFVILTVGLGFIWLWWKRGGTTYRITSQRVIVDRGLFGKTLDQLDITGSATSSWTGPSASG